MNRYLLAFTVIVMFYVIGKAQTSIINWGFFVLSIVNFAFIAKGDGKHSTIMHSRNIANVIKVYSAFLLLFDICFIMFVGEEEKPNQPESLDQIFKQTLPKLYENLDIIGLRIWFDPTEVEPEKAIRK